MASRSSDFKRTDGYDTDRCLKWQDVELIAIGGHTDDEQLTFQMRVTIYNWKGFK
jgi:hypothetical protein